MEKINLETKNVNGEKVIKIRVRIILQTIFILIALTFIIAVMSNYGWVKIYSYSCKCPPIYHD